MRHSVRKFSHKAVSEEVIRMILEAVNQAPAARNQESWRLVLVEGDKRFEFSDLIIEK